MPGPHILSISMLFCLLVIYSSYSCRNTYSFISILHTHIVMFGCVSCSLYIIFLTNTIWSCSAVCRCNPVVCCGSHAIVHFATVRSGCMSQVERCCSFYCHVIGRTTNCKLRFQVAKKITLKNKIYETCDRSHITNLLNLRK